MNHSVISCLMLIRSSIVVSVGACCCSLMKSCSRVVHLDVGSSFGTRGVKSHITCTVKTSCKLLKCAAVIEVEEFMMQLLRLWKDPSSSVSPELCRDIVETCGSAASTIWEAA